MKKLLLTVVLFAFALVGFGQTAYYWVGGVGPTSFTSNSNWNTALDGSGTVRAAAAATDILIFDGTNIGGATPATGLVTATTSSTNFGRLELRNNANVAIERNAVGGTATITVNGDGTATDDVQIPLGSYLTLKPQTGDATGSVNLTFVTAAATARIYGTLDINGGGCRITSATAGSVSFEDGSVCKTNTVLSGQYPFTNVNSKAVVFKSGSTLQYLGGNSVFSNSSTEPIVFQSGSTCEFFATVPSTNSTSSHFFNNKSYANVKISGGATVVGGSFSSIENLTVSPGATFNFAATGAVPVYKNIDNDGTLGVAGVGSSNILFVGNGTNQTIGGTGTFNNLGAISVGADAKLQLLTSINLAGESLSSVLGIIDFGTFTLNGVGAASNTGRFQARGSVNESTTAATITNGSNSVTFANSADYAALNVNMGMLVTGPQIPANTYIVNTNSGTSTLTLSNPAIGSGNSLTVFSPNPTVKTSNAAGIDGSVIVNSNGSINYASETNFVFNGATSTPFSTVSTNNIGDLTVNAPITTNRDTKVTGVLSLNAAKLTVREGDELTMAAGSSFGGTFDANSYIVTSANASTGEVGTVKTTGLTASKMFPVGSATNYLPITLNPTSSSDLSINVFQGATVDATPNGSALTPVQKADLVDAIYNVNRTAGTGDVTISLAWQSGLEGSNFTGFSDTQVGVSRYASGHYAPFVGPGNNTTNEIATTITDDVFGAFLIGKAGTTLPVNLISFTAKSVNQTTVLNWKTTSEVNLSHYLVQRSSDGKSFETLTSLNANNVAGFFNYAFTDNAPAFGANYYQLVSVDTDGKTNISGIQAVNFGTVASLSVYPNPTKGNISVAGLVKDDLITVTDLLGRTLSSAVYDGSGTLGLNIATNKEGIYLLTISNNGRVKSSHRIIKN